MNKIIKKKTRDKLNFKKSVPKEERLFIKQYPILYPVCDLRGIKRLEVKRAFKLAKNICMKLGISKAELEVTFRMNLGRRGLM